MEQKNTFPKTEKLKSKKAIDALFSNGKSIRANPIGVIYLTKTDNTGVLANVGVTVPKKFMKLAVNRNLLKRRMREAYRLNNKEFKTHLKNNNLELNMMFIYSSKQILTYAAIEDKIKVILTRLIEQCEVVDK